MTGFTIIVPVFNETAALEFSNFYFSKIGVEPIYALDSKKIARRAEVERILGRNVVIYDNPGNCIEAHYERLAALAPTDWILRVDCDEVPNPALLAHCTRFVNQPSSNACAFDRDDLIWRGGYFERIKYQPLFFDSQFRLFNRKQVRYVHRIHTPGFHVPKWKLPLVPLWHGPLKARLYHLQREFVSADENARKQQRYNEGGQDPKFFANMMKQDEALRWRSFDDAEFTALFAAWKTSRGK